jgi:hypothetical protein
VDKKIVLERSQRQVTVDLVQVRQNPQKSFFEQLEIVSHGFSLSDSQTSCQKEQLTHS